MNLRTLNKFSSEIAGYQVMNTLTRIRLLKQFNFVFQSRFREAFYKESIITAIVQRLVIDNEELQGYCANAIFKVK